jgi:hypothetical protein
MPRFFSSWLNLRSIAPSLFPLSSDSSLRDLALTLSSIFSSYELAKYAPPATRPTPIAVVARIPPAKPRPATATGATAIAIGTAKNKPAPHANSFLNQLFLSESS